MEKAPWNLCRFTRTARDQQIIEINRGLNTDRISLPLSSENKQRDEKSGIWDHPNFAFVILLRERDLVPFSFWFPQCIYFVTNVFSARAVPLKLR